MFEIKHLDNLLADRDCKLNFQNMKFKKTGTSVFAKSKF